MFWQLVLLVERSAAAVLHWSWWRRLHQVQAKAHHYRRHTQQASPPAPPSAPETAPSAQQAPSQADDIVETVWQRLRPLLPTYERGGHPYTHDRRVIVEAIVHQMRTGCGWHRLPSHFPPYQTVYSQLRKWQKTGIWAIAWEGLKQPRPF